MRYRQRPLSLDIGAGVLIGFGIVRHVRSTSCCRLSASCCRRDARLCARRRDRRRLVRTIPVRAVGVALIDNFGWQPALMVFAILTLLIIPLSLRRCARRRRMSARLPGGAQTAVVQDGAGGSFRPSLLRAAGARLLHLRLPARLHHRASAGLSGRPRAFGRTPAAGCIAAIGLFNIFGSLGVGWLQRQVAEALHPARDLFICALAVDRQSSFRFRSRQFSAIVVRRIDRA